MKRRVTYVIEYLLDDFNNAMIEAMPYNAYRQMTNASNRRQIPAAAGLIQCLWRCYAADKSFYSKVIMITMQ